MTSKDVNIKIDNLLCALDEVDILLRGLRKECYEKCSYISLLRLHKVCICISDLIEALDNLSVIEKGLIGG